MQQGPIIVTSLACKCPGTNTGQHQLEIRDDGFVWCRQCGYSPMRDEVERLTAENAQLKAAMSDSLVLPLLSADQIAELEAQEAAEAAKEKQ
ncbi:MAG: hypothetical protein V1755_06605 [Chloroflexota bacterium]